MLATAKPATGATFGGDMLRQFVNVAGLVLVLVVNFLANALPLNGQSTAAVSDKFPVLFVPAGYVFAIWGLIYLGLTAFTVYQALPAQRTDPLMRRIGYLFALTCALNSAWIFAWHFEIFPLTIVLMLSLLVTLVAIYRRLDVTRAQASWAERLLVFAPFSLYLAWITVATVANLTDVLYWAGWNGFGVAAEWWAAIMLVAAVLIAGLVALPRRDVAYMAVICWAFVGIAVKQAAAPLVANSALVLAALIAVALVASFFVRPGARMGRV